MNPVAGAVFSGIVLVVLVYSILDLTGIANRIGVLGTALPLPVIGGLMYGVFAGLRALRQHKRHIRIKGPMYLRHLMDSCLKRTCGELEAMLNAPETASTTIFNAILLDKMLWIGATDCLRFIDVRRQIEDSGLPCNALKFCMHMHTIVSSLYITFCD